MPGFRKVVLGNACCPVFNAWSCTTCQEINSSKQTTICEKIISLRTKISAVRTTGENSLTKAQRNLTKLKNSSTSCYQCSNCSMIKFMLRQSWSTRSMSRSVALISVKDRLNPNHADGFVCGRNELLRRPTNGSMQGRWWVGGATTWTQYATSAGWRRRKMLRFSADQTGPRRNAEATNPQ